MHGDRRAFFVALGEIVALQNPRHGVLASTAGSCLRTAAAAEPLAVEADLGLRRIEDLEHLRLVGLGVRVDLPRASCGGRVTLRPVGSPIMPGHVADQEDHGVAQVLKVLHLAQQDGVAQVQVGRGGIEAGLDAQGAARLCAAA